MPKGLAYIAMHDVLSAPAHSTALGDLPDLLASGRRLLAAADAPGDPSTYSAAINQLDRFLASSQHAPIHQPPIRFPLPTSGREPRLASTGPDRCAE